MTQLSLKEYASPIHLTDCYEPSLLYLNRKEEMVDELLETFLKEKEELREAKVPRDYAGKRDLLKGILTIREPKPLDVENLNKLDSLLQTELMERGVIEVGPLEPISDIYPNCSFNQSHKFTLWQGDMTRLGADAIVNAANKYLLGCFHPYHACIDNAIHSAAGPQLREDCNTIMSLQGELEDTGGAKITRGYNLPSKFVLHTVGPIIDKGIELTEQQKAELASCYRSDMKRIFAPYAPGIKLRLKALKEVHDAGLSTQASISPVLPFTPDFPRLLEGIVDRIWIDTLTIGDGSMGKRSARLGMPQLFEEHDLSKWYQEDIHIKVGKYFRNSFPSEMIRISKNEAFPI
ncbi:macro domain-containing protein [Paenibacillus alginolyticus]|uniref:macro domain-containing protein n=1 Tax=Paenibacillus alginolyticus TaxID=59839 RepID=UPI0003FD9ED6|nr:macro domain-containing protein [Paenibacillus alginolyticus]MCY9668890.1 macro domain-containing protein [Paenibacillus alginolyticus]